MQVFPSGKVYYRKSILCNFIVNGNAATAIPHATHDMKTEVYMKVLKSFVRIVCYQENLQADVKVSPSYSFFKLEKLTVFF